VALPIADAAESHDPEAGARVIAPWRRYPFRSISLGGQDLSKNDACGL
jgi:hypothetical protein